MLIRKPPRVKASAAMNFNGFFPKFFKQLEDAGNNCPYSIEIEFTAAGPKDLAEVNQAVKDSAGYLIAQGYTL